MDTLHFNKTLHGTVKIVKFANFLAKAKSRYGMKLAQGSFS